MNNPRPIVLGRYSPSQNGIIVSPYGIALCLAGGVRATTWINRKYWLSMTDASILVHYRTEEAKAFRRTYGDRGGCKYGDKYHRPSPNPWSNSITTVTKDNLLCVTFTWYTRREANTQKLCVGKLALIIFVIRNGIWEKGFWCNV